MEKYDLNTNYKFSTYAYSWIKQFIDRFLLTKGRNIYIPIKMQEKIKEYRKKELEFENKHKRKPTYEEISNITGYDQSTIQLIEANLSDSISYDAQINTDEDDSFLVLLQDKNKTPDEIYLEKSQKQI